MERKSYVENNDFETEVDSYVSRYGALDCELVNSEDASGRITAEAVYAKVCDPCYNAAAMDGIAVFSENTVSAAETSPLPLIEGKDFIYVNTGNPVPSRFDAVIMIEDVLVDSETNVRILSPARPWQNVRVVGESVVATEMVLPSFRRIRPIDVGAILASGNDEIKVIKKPRVGIIPTGNEMVESAAELKPGKLRESNTRVFNALTESYGATPHRYGIVEDREESLEAALKKAVVENDLVVINAGSSAGTKDFTVHVIARLGKVFTHGLAVRPGKPTILGEIDGKPVIGVPGYPVSAYLIFDKVVRRVIEKLAASVSYENYAMSATVTKRIVSSLKNEEFVRVAMGVVGDKLVATPLDRGAAAVMSMVKADGLLSVPRNSEGVEAGEEAMVTLLKPVEEIAKQLVIVGSHDMIIDVIGDSLPVSSAHVGSLGGILALKNGACNLAPIHLLDEETGVYNISYVEKYFGNGKMALIKGVGRTQGILVAKGNPKNINSVNDIAKGRFNFANRQGGAGTRILFDYLLKKNEISPADVKGYEKEFSTHLAVATAVSSGTFDCGLAVMTAAKTMGLDFIPVGREEYDFLVERDFLNDERMTRFLEIIKSETFKRKLDELGGYTYERTGEIVLI